MQNYAIKKIGASHGQPRVWIEGRQPSAAGFLPGARFTVEVRRESKSVILRLVSSGERAVSKKEKDGNIIPIIDINSSATLSVFAGLDRVRVITKDGVIHLLPLASDVRKQERLARLKETLENNEPLSVGSLSHGIGVLSLAVHHGFEKAGVTTKLAFANDIRDELLSHAAEANPAWSKDTVMLSAPMQEFALDTWAVNRLPYAHILEAGLPCQGASLSGRAKNATSCAEAHPEVGNLIIAFFQILAAVNPSVILFENVEPYSNTGSAWILRHQLRDMGYIVHERTLDGAEWNVLEGRRRMCLVAVTEGIEFDFADIVKPEPEAMRLGDILDPVPLDAACWSPMSYLVEKEIRDKAQKKGFSMQIVTPDSTKVGTIGKGYAKNRSTEPKVQHPEDPALLRLLSPAEHARAKGIWEGMIARLSATIAHESLGQSILPAPFTEVARTVGNAIMNWYQTVTAPQTFLKAA